MFIFLIITNLLLTVASTVSGQSNCVKVKTKIGVINGVTESSIIKFLGIPYATVNRTNRYGISAPYPPFTNEFNASEYKSKEICSTNTTSLQHTSDCLFLNIYKPNIKKNHLPVVIFFNSKKTLAHLNTKMYSLLENSIVVTIYYRSGIYRFMCLNTPLEPGNQAFKDQYLGIKWIENNINYFGGNRNKINIVNDGYNVIDVNVLYRKGKVYRNGTANVENNNFDMYKAENKVYLSNIKQRPDDTIPRRLSKELGCESNDTAEALMFLSTIDEKSLMKASKKLNITYTVCDTELKENNNGSEDVKHYIKVEVMKNVFYEDVDKDVFSSIFDNVFQGFNRMLTILGLTKR